ncbi:MAG TPA: hypothetical protein VMU36_04820 [Spirochaetia bacterium]|nr:hypothetical protein [Spirochaetia bacterium]
MKRNAAPFLAFCLLAAAPLAAQSGRLILDEPGFSARSSVDWTAGSLDVEVSRQLDPATAALPRAKADATTDIESRLPGFMITALSPVVVDSGDTYGDLLSGDPVLFSRVTELASGARPRELFLSDDFTHLIARYSLPLFGPQGIASPLFPSRSAPIQRGLGWVPNRPFTGLVIYAKGELPAVGSNTMAKARPAIFPRIFDETMTLVMEKGMCDPESLVHWGMVGYATSLDDPVVFLRGGSEPLILAARAVFGTNATDVVIPTDGARQLLTLSENRKLLRDGRIVIIYDSLE